MQHFSELRSLRYSQCSNTAKMNGSPKNDASERSSNRASDRGSDRAIERSSERSSERASDRAIEGAIDRATDRASERSRDRIFRCTQKRCHSLAVLSQSGFVQPQCAMAKGGRRALSASIRHAGVRPNGFKVCQIWVRNALRICSDTRPNGCRQASERVVSSFQMS